MSNQRTGLYRPSNGTEGDWFQGQFCRNCRKDTESKPCGILGKTFIYDVEDKEYPHQWTHNDDGATCTAFDDRRIAKNPRLKKPKSGEFDLFGGAA